MSGFPNKQSNIAGAIPVWGGGATAASDGTIVDPNGWAATFTYAGDGTLTHQDITNPANAAVYRQSFTYGASGPLTRSQWVKQ